MRSLPASGPLALLVTVCSAGRLHPLGCVSWASRGSSGEDRASAGQVRPLYRPGQPLSVAAMCGAPDEGSRGGGGSSRDCVADDCVGPSEDGSGKSEVRGCWEGEREMGKSGWLHKQV